MAVIMTGSYCAAARLVTYCYRHMSAKKQFNLYLDEELIKAVKHSAIEADRRLSDYVAEVLTSHLELRRRVSDRMAQILVADPDDETSP